jgi:uncharacterized membrane protein
VRLLPYGRDAALFCGFLPMAVYEYASVSQDAGVIAVAFLFTGVALACQERGRWRRSDVILGAAAATVLCGSKFVYAPLLLFGLPSALQRERTRHVLMAHAIIVAVALGFTAAWLPFSSGLVIAVERNANFAGQVAFIGAHPGSFLAAMWNSIARSYKFWFQSAVGVFGWLSLSFPKPFYALPMLGFLCCLILPTRRIAPLQAAWNGLLLLASAILLFTALYIYVESVGASVTLAVQGRYFLPLLPLGLITLGVSIPLPSRWRCASARGVVLAIIAIQLVATDLLIITSYQVL